MDRHEIGPRAGIGLIANLAEGLPVPANDGTISQSGETDAAVGERYAWPKPFVVEMQSCGEVGANWRLRRLRLCYEMAQDFAQLYRDYGDKLKSSKKKKKKR